MDHHEAGPKPESLTLPEPWTQEAFDQVLATDPLVRHCWMVANLGDAKMSLFQFLQMTVVVLHRQKEALSNSLANFYFQCPKEILEKVEGYSELNITLDMLNKKLSGK